MRPVFSVTAAAPDEPDKQSGGPRATSLHKRSAASMNSLTYPRAQGRFLDAEPEPHTKYAVINAMLVQLNMDNSVNYVKAF